MTNRQTLERLSDDVLLRRLSDLVQGSRRVEAELIAHIAEVDERRLYASEAASSMHVYCTEVLHLSEAEAYFRMTAARASRKHPMLLNMLADGRLHLTGIAKLAPHLTLANRDALLKRAAHRSKREIEELVAGVSPRPDVPSGIRKLPARTELAVAEPVAGGLVPERVGEAARGRGELGPDRVAAPEATPARRAEVEPLAPERYRVQFTASAELREKLTRLQALMLSSVPDGDLAAIIEQAVSEKLERLEAKRFAKTKAPRKSLAQTDTSARSRYIPAAARRVVRERDGGRCTFKDVRGRRCKARERLEFHHHVHPYGRGGDHRPENVRLACATHNRLLAEREYGKGWMDRFRNAPGDATERLGVGEPRPP